MTEVSRALATGSATRRDLPLTIVRFSVASGTGLALGLAVGTLLADGDAVSAAVTVVLAVATAALARGLAPAAQRDWIFRLAVVAFSLRAATAVLLHAGSVAIGRGGFITGDDQAYAKLAWGFARWLVNDPQPGVIPPYWGSEAYLFGTWVYLETAVFLIFGQRVVIAELVNCALAVFTMLLVADLARRLFGMRAATVAAVLISLYPSLILWASLNLKDGLALLLITLTLWGVSRFQLQHHWIYLGTALGVLILMESLRRYIFVGLALVVPASVAASPGLDRLGRTRWTAGAIILSGLFLSITQAGVGLGPGLVGILEGTRSAMVVGARTAFADPVVPVQPGDTLVIGQARPDGCMVHVQSDAGVVIVVADSNAGEPVPRASDPNVVVVRPGCIIVVGPPEQTPAPEGNRRVLADSATHETQLIPISSSGGDSLALARTINYLPRGVTYALMAPFPWAVSRTLDLATVPDMVLWYVLFIAATVTVWRERSRWQTLLPLVLFAVGTLGIFALAEGNVGTLYRHRSMIIPTVILLAAPTLAGVAGSRRAAT